MNPYLAINQMKWLLTPGQFGFIYSLTHFLIFPWIILKQLPALHHFMCKYLQHITFIFNDFKIATDQGREQNILNHFFIAGHFVFSNFSCYK